MALAGVDSASIGRAVDQVHRDFCRLRPGNLSSEMLRDMVGASFAGIQAMPQESQFNFEYLVQAGFDVRPWVHNKVCELSRDARWDVRGVDHRSSSDIHLFDIFERLSTEGAGGRLRKYFEHIGVRHALMARCVADHGWQYVMFAGRSPGQNPFSETDRARLRAMLPHFRSALRARIRIVVAHAIAETCAAGMESLGVGALLIDRRGQATCLNGLAENIMMAGDGLVVRPRFGAAMASVNQRLQALLRAAAREDWSRGGVAITVPRKSGAGNYELVVDAQPCPSGMDRKGGVVVYIRGCMTGAQAKVEPKLLQQFFGLTEAEAMVAQAAVSGRGTYEIAALLGIQYNTVRAHFRSIYAKCRWSSRSDLVQMVLTSPAVLGELTSGTSELTVSLS